MHSYIFRTTANKPFTYKDLDLFQQKIAESIRTEGAEGALILSEVSPVITAGRRAQKDHFLFPPEYYAAHGVDIVPVDRGGLLTYHGPGQWVFFLVQDCEKLTGDTRGVKKAVCFLLNIISDFLKEKYGFHTQMYTDERLGLWSILRGKKIVSLGVSIKQGVLQHGVSINIYQTPQSFLGITPCGLSTEMSYLCHELKVDSPLEKSFFNQFGDELVRYVSALFKKN